MQRQRAPYPLHHAMSIRWLKPISSHLSASHLSALSFIFASFNIVVRGREFGVSLVATIIAIVPKLMADIAHDFKPPENDIEDYILSAEVKKVEQEILLIK